MAQAHAIVDGLRELPVRLTRAELTQCQESILDHADECPSPGFDLDELLQHSSGAWHPSEPAISRQEPP